MKVKVERCWAGNSDFYWRLSFIDPRSNAHVRQRINDEGDWDRATATAALDILQRYAPRKSIRFECADRKSIPFERC